MLRLAEQTFYEGFFDYSFSFFQRFTHCHFVDHAGNRNGSNALERFEFDIGYFVIFDFNV